MAAAIGNQYALGNCLKCKSMGPECVKHLSMWADKEDNRILSSAYMTDLVFHP